jgi:hypothetical protein
MLTDEPSRLQFTCMAILAFVCVLGFAIAVKAPSGALFAVVGGM